MPELVNPNRADEAERSPTPARKTNQKKPTAGRSGWDLENMAEKKDPRSPAAVLERIDKRLQVTGLSDRAASLAAHKSADLIRSARRQVDAGKVHRITRESLTALAAPLRTNPEWLETGTGDENAMSAPTLLRGPRGTSGGIVVRGAAVVGAWFEGDASDAIASTQGEPETAPADPRFAHTAQYAIVMRDASANRVAQPGDYLIVIDEVESKVIVPRHGDLLVVARTRKGTPPISELSVRRAVAESNKIELRFDSNDARFRTAPTVHVGDPDVSVKGTVVGVYHRVA